MPRTEDAILIEGVARQLVRVCNEVKHDDARAWPQYIKDAKIILEIIEGPLMAQQK